MAKKIDITEMSTREILDYLLESSEKYVFPQECQMMIEVLSDRLDNGTDIDCDDCEWNELCSGEDEIDDGLTDILSNAVQNAGSLDAINAYVKGMSHASNSIRKFMESVLYDDEE